MSSHVTALPLPYGADWERVVADAEDQLRLLDQEYGWLSTPAGPLHEATGGLIGALGPAVRAAATNAVGTTEHLTWEALEQALPAHEAACPCRRSLRGRVLPTGNLTQR